MKSIERTLDRGSRRSPIAVRRAAAFLASGLLLSGAVRPLIDRPFPLSAVVDAHRHLESNTQIGKIVVTVPR
ncbi:zinc-binding dehydrogenase [Actinomadura sp. WMMA1423]|uniref:zinc-binding dehydrogenase n=1 Tax=Actinomadura sp. WMMA1423 TaxID=2591108 RepID=UPI0026771F17|nr:zinc-binding dehydrogenase [Actinomadura sp. WMMA1423]